MMSQPLDEPVFFGIDVGGTNIKVGFVADSGRVLGATSFPTRAERPVVESIARIVEVYQDLIRTLGIRADGVVAAGIGTPGPIDIHGGMIHQPSNLPGWWNFPIRAAIREGLSLPVTFTNDANAAAFGEYWLGSAKELPSVVMFTLGTGVGGGIIVEDQCLEGTNSLAAELGHLCVDWGAQARQCPCGVAGHLEAYSSATAVVRRFEEQRAAGAATLLRDAAVTAKGIAEAAEMGDTLAISIIQDTADYLARGIALVCHTIDPAAVLIGGAMTFGGPQNPIGQQFLAAIKTQVKKSVFPEIAETLRIEYASLGSDAGFIGAAGLARLNHHKSQRQGSDP